jgi:hypothetical protein
MINKIQITLIKIKEKIKIGPKLNIGDINYFGRLNVLLADEGDPDCDICTI